MAEKIGENYGTDDIVKADFSKRIVDSPDTVHKIELAELESAVKQFENMFLSKLRPLLLDLTKIHSEYLKMLLSPHFDLELYQQYFTGGNTYNCTDEQLDLFSKMKTNESSWLRDVTSLCEMMKLWEEGLVYVHLRLQNPSSTPDLAPKCLKLKQQTELYLSELSFKIQRPISQLSKLEMIGVVKDFTDRMLSTPIN